MSSGALIAATQAFRDDRWMAKKAPRKPDEITPQDAAVGRRIVEAREAKGLSAADLARELHSTPTTIWRYETGRMSAASRLVEIATVTGANPEWLRSGDGETTDERTQTVEQFIATVGPTMRPPLSSMEARFVRTYPHHRVTVGKLLDMVLDTRRGMSPDEIGASERETEAARAKGAALGVPRRKER